jgi:hypothetical protein
MNTPSLNMTHTLAQYEHTPSQIDEEKGEDIEKTIRKYSQRAI